MSERPTRREEMQKISAMINEVRFGMMTTIAPDGTLRSRPMTTQEVEFDGDLWFFVGADTDAATESQGERQVNVSFADPGKQSYVSLSGTARLVRDRRKMEEHWNPVYKAWFPQGLDDPNLALLKVSATGAEYWDAPSSKVVRVLGMAKALMTGEAFGENEKLEIRPH